jgi:hypothetical protein
MKTFAQYLTEAEQHQYRPSVGDTVGFEINQELLIETTVAEVLADGIVLSLDYRSVSIMENAGLIQLSEAKLSKTDANFTPDDIKNLESITDLQAMKDAAFELISKPSKYPMKPEKVSWFRQTLDSKQNADQVLKLMWDLYLAGAGMSVMGSTSGTSPNSYRKTFGEDREVRKRYLEILHNIGFEDTPKGEEARKTWKAITGQTHPAAEEYETKRKEQERFQDQMSGIVRSSDGKYSVENVKEDDGDVVKIYHYLEGPGVKSNTTVDWSSYEKMTTQDLDLYVKLGFPTRKDIGSIAPLNRRDLKKLAQERGITETYSYSPPEDPSSAPECDFCYGTYKDVYSGAELARENPQQANYIKSRIEPNEHICDKCVEKVLPEIISEAKYQGREVKIGKPMKGDVKKFKVYIKNPKTGNVKKVNFGDKNMEIKRDDPKRRKNFRARHGCGTGRASDRTKAAYWSCRMWSSKPVSKIVKENAELFKGE